MHKQQIIVGHRAIFDIELSFHGLKFYIVVARKMTSNVIDTNGTLTKEEKKIIQKQIRKELKEKKRREKSMPAFAGKSNLISPSPVEQVLPRNAKIFARTMWITQAKQLIRLFKANLT